MKQSFMSFIRTIQAFFNEQAGRQVHLSFNSSLMTVKEQFKLTGGFSHDDGRGDIPWMSLFIQVGCFLFEIKLRQEVYSEKNLETIRLLNKKKVKKVT